MDFFPEMINIGTFGKIVEVKSGNRKRRIDMKRFVFLVLASLLIAGCTSEFYAHDTLFKNWDHWKFSWWGYEQPTATDAKLSAEQGWWGKEIPYIPAE